MKAVGVGMLVFGVTDILLASLISDEECRIEYILFGIWFMIFGMLWI